MSDLDGKKYVDRLPVLNSGNGVMQLFQVPKNTSNTGLKAVKAVVAALEDGVLLSKSLVFQLTPHLQMQARLRHLCSN